MNQYPSFVFTLADSRPPDESIVGRFGRRRAVPTTPAIDHALATTPAVQPAFTFTSITHGTRRDAILPPNMPPLHISVPIHVPEDRLAALAATPSTCLPAFIEQHMHATTPAAAAATLKRALVSAASDNDMQAVLAEFHAASDAADAALAAVCADARPAMAEALTQLAPRMEAAKHLEGAAEGARVQVGAAKGVAAGQLRVVLLDERRSCLMAIQPVIAQLKAAARLGAEALGHLRAGRACTGAKRLGEAESLMNNLEQYASSVLFQGVAKQLASIRKDVDFGVQNVLVELLKEAILDEKAAYLRSYRPCSPCDSLVGPYNTNLDATNWSENVVSEETSTRFITNAPCREVIHKFLEVLLLFTPQNRVSALRGAVTAVAGWAGNGVREATTSALAVAVELAINEEHHFRSHLCTKYKIPGTNLTQLLGPIPSQSQGVTAQLLRDMSLHAHAEHLIPAVCHAAGAWARAGEGLVGQIDSLMSSEGQGMGDKYVQSDSLMSSDEITEPLTHASPPPASASSSSSPLQQAPEIIEICRTELQELVREITRIGCSRVINLFNFTDGFFADNSPFLPLPAGVTALVAAAAAAAPAFGASGDVGRVMAEELLGRLVDSAVTRFNTFERRYTLLCEKIVKDAATNDRWDGTTEADASAARAGPLGCVIAAGSRPLTTSTAATSASAPAAPAPAPTAAAAHCVAGRAALLAGVAHTTLISPGMQLVLDVLYDRGSAHTSLLSAPLSAEIAGAGLRVLGARVGVAEPTQTGSAASVTLKIAPNDVPPSHLVSLVTAQPAPYFVPAPAALRLAWTLMMQNEFISHVRLIHKRLQRVLPSSYREKLTNYVITPSPALPVISGFLAGLHAALLAPQNTSRGAHNFSIGLSSLNFSYAVSYLLATNQPPTITQSITTNDVTTLTLAINERRSQLISLLSALALAPVEAIVTTTTTASTASSTHRISQRLPSLPNALAEAARVVGVVCSVSPPDAAAVAAAAAAAAPAAAACLVDSVRGAEHLRAELVGGIVMLMNRLGSLPENAPLRLVVPDSVVLTIAGDAGVPLPASIVSRVSEKEAELALSDV